MKAYMKSQGTIFPSEQPQAFILRGLTLEYGSSSYWKVNAAVLK